VDPALNPADLRLRQERIVFARMRSTQDRVADALWFAVWIALNEGLLGHAGIFDPYPYGLLTMIVSLEAIFLSTFVMVSQNRQAARENVRADLDFETNLRSEVWSAHIGAALGLDPHEIEQRVQELLTENRAKMNGGTKQPS